MNKVHFTFNTIASDHAQHNGETVTIVRPLTSKEADLDETGPMYLVELVEHPGRFEAFKDELTVLV